MVAGTRVQGMEDKQENEIHHSYLTFVLRVPLKVCIVSSSKRQPLSHVILEESGSRDGVEGDLTESRKYVPQNRRREISSEKCSVWNPTSHIEQWFIEHSGALSMILRLIMGQGSFANARWDGTSSNEQDLANGNVLKRPQINFFLHPSPKTSARKQS